MSENELFPTKRRRLVVNVLFPQNRIACKYIYYYLDTCRLIRISDVSYFNFILSSFILRLSSILCKEALTLLKSSSILSDCLVAVWAEEIMYMPYDIQRIATNPINAFGFINDLMNSNGWLKIGVLQKISVCRRHGRPSH